MIENKIKSYFEKEKAIIAVYIFGSYASGTERFCSDMDLAILFDNRDLSAVNSRLDTYLIELSGVLRKDIHLTAMDFAGEVLLKQIFKKGKCLVLKDKKKLAYFKMIAYSKIADFEYHHRNMQSGIIRNVMGV